MKLISMVAVFLLITLLSLGAAQEASNEQVIAPAETAQKEVPEETMKRIYEEVKTPYKYGIIIRGEGGKKVDCPSVFRHADKWYLVYIIFDGNGYETAIAESNDLLQWGTLGKIGGLYCVAGTHMGWVVSASTIRPQILDVLYRRRTEGIRNGPVSHRDSVEQKPCKGG
jgi:hypothetical protein